MKTRAELIQQLRKPIVIPVATFGEFKLLIAKLDLIAEALAVILDEQRPR